METRFEPGEVIGKCTIEAFIAAGGMGAVYRAHQPLLNRTVALKVLNSQFTSQADVVGRFVREGKLAARLDHPSIIRMYDAAEENHQYFLIMEYVEGKSLSEIIKRSGPLPVRDVLRLARDVAEALEYAHSQGVVHRDIKPGNILLTKDGQAKVADFGIARSMETDSQLTQTGEIIGTPSYMSPEQCRGLTIDGRSDLYSLGATLYMVLARRQPFKGASGAALVHRIVHDRPPPLQSLVPDVPDNVLRLVQRLMAKHRGARYQTGKEVVAAIEEITQARFTVARSPVKTVVKSGGWPLSLTGTVGAAAMVCFICCVAYLVWPTSEQALAREGQTSSEASGSRTGQWESPSARPSSRKSPRRRPERTNSSRSQPADLEVDITDKAQLEKRINAFSRALSRGQTQVALRFVDPQWDHNPSAEKYLDGVVQAMRAMSAGGRARHRILPRGPDRAQVVLFFQASRSAQSMAVPVEWVHRSEGWFVNPER